MRTYLLLLFLAAVAIYSCTSKEGPAPDTGDNPGNCESMQITSAYTMQIMQTYCTGCHSGATAPAGADFSTLQKVRSFIGSNETTFRLRVTSPQADMPQGGTMRQSIRDSISCWISKGMPE